MFCQFGALNSTLNESSLSIHESFIENEFGQSNDVPSSLVLF